MGDNLVLLTPREGERMDEIIKMNNEWFVSIFEDIEPWSESYVAGHKIFWVRCYGLPLTLWNKDYFSKVVGEVASLVDIDASTLSWENLEFARLQVRLIKSGTPELMKGFKINGQIYNISIVEEKPCQGKGESLCPEYLLTSSDSISSSETVVEEMFFSGISGGDGEDIDVGAKRWSGIPEEEGQQYPQSLVE